MEEEMMMRQKLMNNQLQMMTKLQSDFPAFELGIQDPKKNDSKLVELEDELKTAMEEKINDIKVIFKIKEEKIIENYEQVIKDLENKLDIEQGRFRDAADNYKEDRERLIDDHKAAIERIHEDNMSMYNSMKSEYLNVIENLKSLRKIELESQNEMNGAVGKIFQLSENVDSKLNNLESEKVTMSTDVKRQLEEKEKQLKSKELELNHIQESILQRQEASEKERKDLIETISKLEGTLRKKEIELESEKRQILYEQEQIEIKKNQFEEHKDIYMTNLKRERDKIYKDRENYNKSMENLKQDLQIQLKQLKMEKARYTIHKRLGYNSGFDIQEPPKENNSQEVEEIIKILDHEKVVIKKMKEKLKKEESKLNAEKKKLSKQRQSVSSAVEKLYEVEIGINEKFEQLCEIQNSLEKSKGQELSKTKEFNELNESVTDFFHEVEAALIELMKQEQKVKNEIVTLTSERKKFSKTRQSLLCSACAKPMRKSLSFHELRNVEDKEDFLFKKKLSPAAWMDCHVDNRGSIKNISRNLGIFRSSGDGASLEGLDSHVSTIKRDAENDKKYLNEEIDYLRTLQSINVKTLAKYH